MTEEFTVHPPVRRYRPADLDAMYRVCLLTGDSGRDASRLFSSPRLLGEVFVAPYATLQPDLAFVLDDGSGVEGYVLGALDTVDFGRRCQQHWWPDVRRRYQDFVADPELRDQWIVDWIAEPPPSPTFVDRYPSHLHIDLLPRWQSGGWGRRLIETLCDALRAAGSTGVHLGAAATNIRALGFYEHLGFVPLDNDGVTAWMGLSLTDRR